MTETEKVMNELNQWIFRYYKKGANEERESNIHHLANYLIKESKEQGIDLSLEAALKRAEELLS